MASLSGLMMPTIMLSGYVFPIDNMPYILQLLSNVIPAKWFVIIVRGIMLKGCGFFYIWLETSILAGMTLTFLILTVKKFKIRLQ